MESIPPPSTPLIETPVIDFETAVEQILCLNQEPKNEDKLILYGLFKQSTVGDVNIDCPSMFNMTARAKWYAWNEYKGKTNDQAKVEYVATVTRLIAEHGLKIV